MFWKDPLKEEEFKRLLKEKRPATFRTHGYSQTSFSTPHFKTKVNIHTLLLEVFPFRILSMMLTALCGLTVKTNLSHRLFDSTVWLAK